MSHISFMPLRFKYLFSIYLVYQLYYFLSLNPLCLILSVLGKNRHIVRDNQPFLESRYRFSVQFYLIAIYFYYLILRFLIFSPLHNLFYSYSILILSLFYAYSILILCLFYPYSMLILSLLLLF
jgi:hypothetical protein